MIEVSNLCFSYSKKEKFISNLSFKINKGEIFGLLGPSGAGKSTLQKILTGNIRSYQGSVKVLGVEAKAFNNSFYNKIGVSFEFPNLYTKYSAIQNLHYFGSLYTNQLLNPKELLTKVGLDNDMNKLVKDYSKGMKMRLNFIRAILHQPQILFLDEPTSGLDPINAKIIKDIIKDLRNKGTTIILTTHNMHDVEELCDRVAFINKGMILKINQVDELIEKKETNKVTYLYLENGEKKVKESTLNELNESFIQIVKEKRLISIHSKEANLNDLFIQLTGSDLDVSS